ncbi:glycosyltransferase [Desulfobacula sp.]|uniref:glycosyltransferase n=1 Tax=Desulfobacula sp. TaxID=2593537 RepID=UPI002612B05B|nr:glycosyltransferase [Desulfobacula sp.]
MNESKKIVYVDFHAPETYRENGRHIFAILNPFIIEGFQVYISKNVQHQLEKLHGNSITDWPPPARLMISLSGLKVVDSLSLDFKGGIYIFDKKDKKLIGHPWHKWLQVKFDIFSPYRFSKPILLPYNVHPMNAKRVVGESLNSLRIARRNVRILFAGDLEGYKRRWISFPKEKLSRLNVISTIKERLDSPLLQANSPEELNTILESVYSKNLVIIDNDESRVAWEQWMDVIAHADFFLCPPGIVMPMCHNIIEAMAIGTIPLTNYPEWLSPKLDHLKNCVVFDNEDDLIEKINMVLAMSDEKITEMRENAIKYYEENLKPETFVRKVESHTERKLEILMYSEYNVAKKTKKFNARSVLSRGEEAVGNWAWLSRAWR